MCTKDKRNPSLDIEAPTKMDRDKFAKAFSRFPKIPPQDKDNNTDHSWSKANASAVSLDILSNHK